MICTNGLIVAGKAPRDTDTHAQLVGARTVVTVQEHVVWGAIGIAKGFDTLAIPTTTSAPRIAANLPMLPPVNESIYGGTIMSVTPVMARSTRPQSANEVAFPWAERR